MATVPDSMLRRRVAFKTWKIGSDDLGRHMPAKIAKAFRSDQATQGLSWCFYASTHPVDIFFNMQCPRLWPGGNLVSARKGALTAAGHSPTSPSPLRSKRAPRKSQDNT